MRNQNVFVYLYSAIKQKLKINNMKLTTTVNKIEKAFKEKMNINNNGQYFLNGISFYSVNGEVNFITVNGSNVDNVSKALKKFNK